MLLMMMPLLSFCGRKKLETVSHGLVHSTSTSLGAGVGLGLGVGVG